MSSKQEGVFYILQDIRLGELTEYEAQLKLQELGVVIKVDRELPCAENNMGNISEKQCLAFFQVVKDELELNLNLEFTPATPSICLGDKILLCEKDIDYPWFTKQMILHEIAHHLVPEDKTHGTRFHKKYAELVNSFLAGYVAVEPLIIESNCKGIDGKPYIVGTSGVSSAVEPLIKEE